ncbi:MAG: 5'-methylthioadenosine/adenosylhomocysteine nucleosidase [Clostridia bacterium]|nr:5'-methylthioadenosine/adenosylhomocysteine nucleosidase [Clostridia bacterium]
MSTSPIGIIGAMSDEVDGLISKLEDAKSTLICGVKFYTGALFGKPVVIARCGVGKVFASICATAMIINFAPRLIVNTGVGGALSPALACADIVVAEKLVQYDMDTSPLGDPKGLVSGINKIYFETDERAASIIIDAARELGIPAKRGIIATGDKFVADKETKDKIVAEFSADVCEMEGAAIAHAAYVSGIPSVVVRAISDGADGNSPLDFPTFLSIAVKSSEALTLALVERY